MNPSLIEICGDGLTIEKVASVARQNIRVELTSNIDVRNKISASRQLLEKKLTAGEIIYGVNTGFGGNVICPSIKKISSDASPAVLASRSSRTPSAQPCS